MKLTRGQMREKIRRLERETDLLMKEIERLKLHQRQMAKLKDKAPVKT